MRRTSLVLPMIAFCLFCFAGDVQPHQLNTGYLAIQVTTDSLFLDFTFDITDLERVFAIDADSNATITLDELAQRLRTMQAFFERTTRLRIDYLPVHLQWPQPHWTKDAAGNLFLQWRLTLPLPNGLHYLSLRLELFEAFGENFKVLVKAQAGQHLAQYVLFADAPALRFAVEPEGMELSRQLATFVRLGVEHIFIGIDHILFLIGLIIVGGRFIDLVKIVTSFTVAHSLTLILAALQVVNLPPRLVESAIALSIVYVAVENFFVTDLSRRWMVTGFFGLVHGFGFAGVLRDLGLPTRGLVPSLLSFNVGVEVGQVVIVSLLLPVVWGLQRLPAGQVAVRLASAVIFVFGLTWFLDRAFHLPVALL